MHASGLTLDEAGLAKVRDLTLKWSDKIRGRDHISLAWPANLYVPGEADYHQVWFIPPPHEKVYQFDWIHSTNPDPTYCQANNGSGYMLSIIMPPPCRCMVCTARFAATIGATRAAALYTKACDGGFAPGCYNLAILFEDGRGVGKDEARAAGAYARGCALGDPVSCARGPK